MLSREEVLNQTDDGKIFSVVFIKLDGTIRHMTCRFGVKSALAGGPKAYNDAEKGILTVFDMKAQGYRAIKMENVLRITAKENVIYERSDAKEILDKEHAA